MFEQEEWMVDAAGGKYIYIYIYHCCYQLYYNRYLPVWYYYFFFQFNYLIFLRFHKLISTHI